MIKVSKYHEYITIINVHMLVEFQNMWKQEKTKRRNRQNYNHGWRLSKPTLINW